MDKNITKDYSSSGWFLTKLGHNHNIIVLFIDYKSKLVVCIYIAGIHQVLESFGNQ